MSKKVNINVSDLDNIINALQTYIKDLNEISKTLPKSIAEEGLKKLDKEYENLYDDENLTDIHTTTRKTENGYDLVAYGNDVVYAEFGTGDKGQDDKHPLKSDYDLNDYNSGPCIRDVSDLDEWSYTKEDLNQIGITSGKYWMYEKDGSIHYTQGVPAGKQMYNTFNYLADKGIEEVVKKEVGAINDKFINSIKK